MRTLILIASILIVSCSGQPVITPDDIRVVGIISTCDASVNLSIYGVPAGVHIDEAECTPAGCSVSACVEVAGIRQCQTVTVPLIVDGSGDPPPAVDADLDLDLDADDGSGVADDGSGS